MDHWDLIECDLHEVYGIDAADPQILDGRPWQWFLRRVRGLGTTECRLQRKLSPPPDQIPPSAPSVPSIPSLPAGARHR